MLSIPFYFFNSFKLLCCPLILFYKNVGNNFMNTGASRTEKTSAVSRYGKIKKFELQL